MGLNRVELSPRPVERSQFDVHTLNNVSVSGNIHASAFIEGCVDPANPVAPSITGYSLSLRPNPYLSDNAITGPLAYLKTEVTLLHSDVGLVNETSTEWTNSNGATVRMITKTYRVDLEVKEINYAGGKAVDHEVHSLPSQEFLFIAPGEN